MKKRFVAVCTTLVGLFVLGSARAETLNSKLADMVATVVDGESTTTSREQAITAAPGDDAEQQALTAEARDAVDQALENARDDGSKEVPR